jgi:hypothetical protein
MTSLQIILLIVFWLIVGGLSYALVYPYVDTLMQKVILNVIGIPSLFAMFLPMIRGERPAMIAVYFGYFGVAIAITTALFHFIEQKYRRK